MLTFMQEIFAMPDKFTKYVFDEELMLFYIRTHYISFVRLYNKNFNKRNLFDLETLQQEDSKLLF